MRGGDREDAGRAERHQPSGRHRRAHAQSDIQQDRRHQRVGRVLLADRREEDECWTQREDASREQRIDSAQHAARDEREDGHRGHPGDQRQRPKGALAHARAQDDHLDGREVGQRRPLRQVEGLHQPAVGPVNDVPGEGGLVLEHRGVDPPGRQPQQHAGRDDDAHGNRRDVARLAATVPDRAVMAGLYSSQPSSVWNRAWTHACS